jgi:hypothetical protein
MSDAQLFLLQSALERLGRVLIHLYLESVYRLMNFRTLDLVLWGSMECKVRSLKG